MYKVAPLSSSFMLVAILGFLFSMIYVYNKNPSWGFAFALVFAAMFFASMYSMSKAPLNALEQDKLLKSERKIAKKEEEIEKGFEKNEEEMR